ncbi:MAG TPA: MoxR family ATPase [Planctomycetota bacterium]|nr:MoxR family ATPase [Planctomycetota bacterium]
MKTIRPGELIDFLLHVASVRPVFIWGPPGIGKSSLVEQFAIEVGIDVVTLLGTQLAPEDLIGVPQIVGGKSRFCPPEQIAREEPYLLFLDELNASSTEVQKAFYSLIHDRRLGNYKLHKNSIVIGAGNRAHDQAIVRQMSSALINRMVHVELKADAQDWLKWAAQNDIHADVMDYIRMKPDQLHAPIPKTQEPFSTPRSWHILSDCMKSYGEALDVTKTWLLAQGVLSPSHAAQFKTFAQMRREKFNVEELLRGEKTWPRPQDGGAAAGGDTSFLYMLVQMVRAQLLRRLPQDSAQRAQEGELVHNAKRLIKDLAEINLELAQVLIGDDETSNKRLPDWFMLEIVRDLPRLAAEK